jgi:hypothetical protein
VNAILVSVGYTDCLRLSLPYNRHHFERVMVVTSGADAEDVLPVVVAARAELHVTDAFYARGALFNKWAALEEGLDRLGREGWLTILDADVLWPKSSHAFRPVPGNLYTPLRRMCPDVPDRVPPEANWRLYAPHRQQAEWAGYTQVFHASDPALGPTPWHDTGWAHAGGADSFFQQKWPASKKLRPPFEVLHMGPSGVNWAGKGNEQKLREMIRRRKPGTDRFAAEKLK